MLRDWTPRLVSHGPAARSADHRGRKPRISLATFTFQCPDAQCSRPPGLSKASHATQFALPANSLHSGPSLPVFSFGQGLESDRLMS